MKVGTIVRSAKNLIKSVLPDSALPYRDAIARRYIRGSGLEIGAQHCPLFVPISGRVKYVDRKSRQDSIADFPDLEAWRIVEPDFIGDGFSLDFIPDASQDFVIANHVIEHSPDPLGVLCAWSRVLRAGGVLFLAIPIAERCFDKGRALTPLNHFMEDMNLYRAGEIASLRDKNREHYREWVAISEPPQLRQLGQEVPVLSEEEARKNVEHRLDIGQEIHFHTFSPGSCRELLDLFCSSIDPRFELAAYEVNLSLSETIAVLRKRGV